MMDANNFPDSIRDEINDKDLDIECAHNVYFKRESSVVVI